MKALSLTITAVVLAAAASLSPVAAQAQTAASTTAQVSQQSADNAPAPHYEWQYHYVGRHPRYEGHWVLVR